MRVVSINIILLRLLIDYSKASAGCYLSSRNIITFSAMSSSHQLSLHKLRVFAMLLNHATDFPCSWVHWKALICTHTILLLREARSLPRLLPTRNMKDKR